MSTQINDIVNLIKNSTKNNFEALKQLKQYMTRYHTQKKNLSLELDDMKYVCLVQKKNFKMKVPLIKIKNKDKLVEDIEKILNAVEELNDELKLFFMFNPDSSRFNFLLTILSYQVDLGNNIYNQLMNMIELNKTSAVLTKERLSNKNKNNYYKTKCASFVFFNNAIPQNIRLRFLVKDLDWFKSYMECAVLFPKYSGIDFYDDTKTILNSNMKQFLSDEENRKRYIYYHIFRTFKNNISASYTNEVDNIFKEGYLNNVLINTSFLENRKTMSDYLQTDAWFEKNQKDNTYTKEATRKLKKFCESILGYMIFYVVISKKINITNNVFQEWFNEVKSIVGDEPLVSNCVNRLSEGNLTDDDLRIMDTFSENKMNLDDEVTFRNDYFSDIESDDDNTSANEDSNNTSENDDGNTSANEDSNNTSESDDGNTSANEDSNNTSESDDGNTSESDTDNTATDNTSTNEEDPVIEKEYNDGGKSAKKGITSKKSVENVSQQENLEVNTKLIRPTDNRLNYILPSDQEMEKEFNKNINSVVSQRKREVAPVEDFQLQTTRKGKNKLIYTMSYKRKGKQYSAIAEVQKNTVTINRVKTTTEYECRLKEMKVGEDEIFKQKISQEEKIEIVSKIYKTFNGENYSDNTTKLNEKINGPSYNSSDHKLIDLNGWVLYLDMVYPGQTGICTQSVIFCLIASIKNFELLENEPLNNGSVWIGSKNVKEAFYCYKNAFHICGYDFKGNHQYTLFNGLNFNLAHVSNDDQVHFKAPGREMKFITKETALEMKKDDIVKKIYILRSEEKNVRDEITKEKKKTYLPRYFNLYLELIQKRNPDLLKELDDFFEEYKNSDEDYNYRINIIEAKLDPDLVQQNKKLLPFQVIEMVDKFVLKLIEDLNENYDSVNLPEGEWRLFNPKIDPGVEGEYFRSFPQHYSMHLGFKKVMDPFPLVYSRPSMTGTSHSETLQIESESDNEY